MGAASPLRSVLDATALRAASAAALFLLIGLLHIDASDPLWSSRPPPWMQTLLERTLACLLLLESSSWLVVVWKDVLAAATAWLKSTYHSLRGCCYTVAASLRRSRGKLAAPGAHEEAMLRSLADAATFVGTIAEAQHTQLAQAHVRQAASDAVIQALGSVANRSTPRAPNHSYLLSRRVASEITGCLHVAEALVLALLVLGFAMSASAPALAFGALVLLPLRLSRAWAFLAAAVTSRSLEQEQCLQALSCRGLPYRGLVIGLAMLVALSGLFMLLVGTLAEADMHMRPEGAFLRAGMPRADGGTIALLGAGMLLVAACVWVATFFSADVKCTLYVLLGCITLVLTIRYLAEASLSTDRQRELTTALRIGRESLFSDEGLAALAAAASAAAARSAAAANVPKQIFTSTVQGEHRTGSAADAPPWAASTAPPAPPLAGLARMLREWEVRREAFEAEYAECGGAYAYNSTWILQACAEAGAEGGSDAPKSVAATQRPGAAAAAHGLDALPKGAREAVCANPPHADRYVLYCEREAPFGDQASRWCLHEPTARLVARTGSARFQACANSNWWPEPMSAHRSEGRQAGASGVQLPLSAKALFCLCEDSSDGYVALLGWHTTALRWARKSLSHVASAVLCVLFFLVCGPLCCGLSLDDTSRYYDEELL